MIKWITNKLGTAAWEHVKEEHSLYVVDVRDMVDRAGNRSELAEEKIREALSHLGLGKRVVIACDYGMSRSNAIAAGVLAKLENLSLSEAVLRVMAATGEKALKIEVLTKVSESLGITRSPIIRKDDNCRRLLITGGTGVLGSALIPELADTYDIVAPKREEIDLLHGTIDLDLMVKEREIDCIIHFANPRVYTNNSAMGETLCILKNVLDVCSANSVKLIYPSSWEVYSGYRSAKLLASEALPRLPKGPYGETKYLGELLIENHHHNYGLKYAIIRSAPVYGAGDRPKFIHNFIDKALRGDDIWAHCYLNGYPILDLLHVTDFVAALKALVTTSVRTTVNVGAGVGYSTTDVAHMINSMLGRKSIVGHRKIEDFAPNVVMDIARAKSVLDWMPKTDIQEELSRMVESASRRQSNFSHAR